MKKNEDYIKESEDLFADAITKQEKLLEIAFNGHAKYFMDATDINKVYAFINNQHGFKESTPIYSLMYERWLRGSYYKTHKGTVGEQVFNDCLAAITARVCYSDDQKPEEIELFYRVAKSKDDDNTFYYDLYDGRVVKITPGHVNIIADDKPIFKRSQTYLKQPIKDKNYKGKFGELVKLLKLNDIEGMFYKVVTITRFIPTIQHVIFTVYGSQGSGKSTMQRYMKMLVDPSSLENIALQRDINELVQLISHSYSTMFDNVTDLNDAQADTLCKAATGGGLSKRKLYTDDEDIIYKYKRPIMLNAINLPSTRSDLIERSVLFNMQRISKSNRKEQTIMDDKFESLRPYIVYECLDILSQAMKIVDNVRKDIKELPRMADFAIWGEAIARTMGYEKKHFYDKYMELLANYDVDIIEEYPHIQILLEIVDKETAGQLSGTPTDIWKLIKDYAKENNWDPKELPKKAHFLTRDINQLIPNLHNLGYAIIQTRTKERRQLTIQSIHKLASPASPASPKPKKLGIGDANDANDANSGIFSKGQTIDYKGVAFSIRVIDKNVNTTLCAGCGSVMTIKADDMEQFMEKVKAHHEQQHSGDGKK